MVESRRNKQFRKRQRKRPDEGISERWPVGSQGAIVPSYLLAESITAGGNAGVSKTPAMLLLQQPQTTTTGPGPTTRTCLPLLNPPLSAPPFGLSHDLNNGHDAVSDEESAIE